MRYLILLISLIATQAIGDWSPPSNPDPVKILDEARDDFDNNNYEASLAKHLWFHENALKYRRSLYGVRLSFALSDWHDLAKAYPKALDSIKETRDRSEIDIRNGIDVYDNFNDFESINKILSENIRTVELFEWLDINHPDRAKFVYLLAEADLVSSKKYKLSGKYIDPDNTYLKYVRNYHRHLEYVRDRNIIDERSNFAKDYLIHNVSTLVALLVQNERKDEASNILDMALLELDDPDFKVMLNDALNGTFPKRWP